MKMFMDTISGIDPIDLKVRLSKKTEYREDGCWIWVGSKLRGNYGNIGINDHTVQTHRLSYALYNGDFDASLLVCHRCDTPSCINPNHLFLGTHLDNAKDKVIKHRQPCGYSNPKTFLSWDDVIEIRNLWNTKSMSMHKIAKKFGVVYSHVNAIIHNKVRIYEN